MLVTGTERTFCGRRLDFRLGGDIYRNGELRVEAVDPNMSDVDITCTKCKEGLR